MQRILGATAVFAGWLTIAVGAMAGLFTSEFLGLAHTEGTPPPLAVYGISAGVILWVFIFAAFLAGFPLAYAMFAEDPRRRLRVIAVAMTICGLGLALDPLGRAFGLPLLAGAACLWAGGELIHKEAVSPGSRVVAVGEDGAHTEPQVATDPHLTQAATSDAAPETQTETETETETPPKARTGRKRTSRTAPKAICPWCSAEIPAQTQTCPECHASLGESDVAALGIPGVTEVQPSLLKYLEESRAGKRRGGILNAVFSSSAPSAPMSTIPPSEASALRPPSAEIKAEMARLDAEIAEGQTGAPEPQPPQPHEAPEPPEPPAS